MKKLHFGYMMSNSFDSNVTNHRFSLKCCPCDNARQKVQNISVQINNEPKIFYDCDTFGNKVINGIISEPHNLFEVIVSGDVTTGLDICEEYETDICKIYAYKYFTPFTKPEKLLTEAYKNSNTELIDAPYDKANYILHLAHRLISYQKGVTDITTTAEQAMEKKAGVCQDYAHIMLALCRMAKLPSRYVVGMIVGEGESHAWTEVLCRGIWYGFDPTNNKLTDDDYIKISCGRDYNDCTVNKGVFTGFTNQHQNVRVCVTENK